MHNKRNKNIIIGYLLIFISVAVIGYNYFAEKRDLAFTEMNLEYYSLENPVEELDEIKTPEVESEKEIKEENKEHIESNYFIGTLEIPKINLNKGFVDPSSIDNNVSKNVTVVSPSNMPNVEAGNLILAAHSGNSYLSFFKDLYILEKGDLAYVTYKNQKYTYKIVNIYLQEKTGKIGIYRDYNKSTLTLVTCTKDDELHQTIYILEQI